MSISTSSEPSYADFRDRLERAGDATDRARLLVEWARASRLAGKAAAAVPLAERALAELGEAPPRASGRFSFGSHDSAGPVAPAARAPAPAEARRLEAACAALAELALGCEAAGEMERLPRFRRRALELAAALGPGTTYASALGRRALAIAESGEVERAEAHLRALRALATRAAPGVVALARSFEALALLEVGRAAEAREAAAAARREGAASGRERLAATIAAARIAASAGEAAAARALADEAAALAAAEGDAEAAAAARTFDAFARFLGEEEEALPLLERAGSLARRHGNAPGGRLARELEALARALAGPPPAAEAARAGPPDPPAPSRSRALLSLMEAEAALAGLGGEGVPRPPLAEASRLLARAEDLGRRALDACKAAPALAARARMVLALVAVERGERGALEEIDRALAAVRAEGFGALDLVPALLAAAESGRRLAGRDPAPLYREAAELAERSGATLLERRARRLLEKEAVGDARAAAAREMRQLESLVEVGRALSSILELEPLLERIMDAVLSLLGAERGFVMLYGAGGKLEPRVARNLDRERLSGPDLQLSRTALAEVERTGLPLVVVDALVDPRFQSQSSIVKLAVRSILCYPLRTPRQVLGFLYADARAVMEFLRTRNAELVVPFVSQAAVAIENAFAVERIHVLYEETLSIARAREKILAHLAHELRTPVSLALGALDLVGRKVGGPLAPACTMAAAQLGRLVEIEVAIADIYGLAEAPPQRIAAKGLLEKLVAGARAKAAARSVEIAVAAPGDLAALAPHRPLGIALESMLKNAIENTPDEGRVELSATAGEGGSVTFAVRDFGVGIVAADLPRIFDGFFHTQETSRYSSRRPYDFDAGGKGLDLLRVKTFAERFGWRLGYESERCSVIPAATDVCPGKISACRHCAGPGDCIARGGSTFRLTVKAAP
jgi:signal transduction histidine kinase